MTLTPFVSILMPVYNETLYIERALEAVLAQNYPSDRMEILVSDGMSNDGTREVVRRYQERHSNLRLIDNPRKIAAAGLNAAILHAKGEIIVRVDGHCEIAPDYVRRSVELLQNKEADMVGGPIETLGETFVASAIAIAMSSRFGVGGSAFRTAQRQKKFVDTAAFFACRKEILAKAGTFDEELVRNQDDEYNYRLRKMGFRILLDPAIRSRYYSRASLISLWRQYFQYGFWKVRVLQKHPRQMQSRQFVPFLFVLNLLMAVILSLAAPSLGILYFLAIVWVYGAFNLFFSLAFALQKGFGYFILLPAVFLTLHLSYGLGFLKGLIFFRKRWKST